MGLFFLQTTKTNMTNTHNLQREIQINRADLDRILDHSLNPELMSRGKEAVLWNKYSLMNIVNSKLSAGSLNQEKIIDKFSWYNNWRKENSKLNFKYDELWEKVKNKDLIKDVISEKKDLNSSNIIDYIQFLQTNKETILSELKLTTSLAKNKPLGDAGDISINELINKGLDTLDTPLVQMIRENVDVSVAGSLVSSMIIYKTIVNLYMKSAFNSSSILESIKGANSTRSKEVALFMIIGAPLIVGSIMSINAVTSGGAKKVIVNIVGNNELEVTSSVSSSSSLFLFLFLNKLPSWLKVLLKYLALYLIILIIVKVIGYNSNIIREIHSQFNVYLVYFLKLFCILNFLVVIYYILKLYILIMFTKNKEFVNPEDYQKLIKIELIELKEIAIKLSPLEQANISKFYFKLILLYSSISLFGLTMMVLIQ